MHLSAENMHTTKLLFFEIKTIKTKYKFTIRRLITTIRRAKTTICRIACWKGVFKMLSLYTL